MKNMEILVFQTKVWTDKEKNLEQMAQQMAEASLEGVDLVTFPEMFCCPYDNGCFPRYAEKEGGKTWKHLSEMAKKHHVYLSAGTVPELGEDGKIYNTAYVFDRDGHQICRHRKIHLFDIDIKNGQYFKESDVLAPGNNITVFDTEFGKMGLCICYDLRFPELARLMADEGAFLLLVPAAFNMTTGPSHWELLFRSRAVDNQVYIIGTAPARDAEASYHSWGHSLAVDPWGDILSELDEKPGSFKCTLNLEKQSQIREQLPLLKHRRKDIYDIVKKV